MTQQHSTTAVDSSLPQSLGAFADVELKSLQSPSGRTAAGAMVKFGTMFQDSNGPVLLCFFRRLG
jgi:hypothetical protein